VVRTTTKTAGEGLQAFLQVLAETFRRHAVHARRAIFLQLREGFRHQLNIEKMKEIRVSLFRKPTRSFRDAIKAGAHRGSASACGRCPTRSRR
jgi:hypothetical protein